MGDVGVTPLKCSLSRRKIKVFRLFCVWCEGAHAGHQVGDFSRRHVVQIGGIIPYPFLTPSEMSTLSCLRFLGMGIRHRVVIRDRVPCHTLDATRNPPNVQQLVVDVS